MSASATKVDPACVDRTPSVWFARLERAIRDRDPRAAITAQQRLRELGYDVSLTDGRASR